MLKRFLVFFLVLSYSLCASTTEQPSIQTLEEMTGFPTMGWIQKGERWTYQNWMENQREDLLPVLNELALFEKRQATEDHYNYAVVTGSLFSSVKLRLGFLIDEWSRGVRFDEIVILTGQRKLHPIKESAEVLGCTLATEVEMIQYVWENIEMPLELREVPLTLIDAKPLPFRERPNTLVTAETWLQQNPKPGTCLLISSQPFLEYQYQTLRMVLPVEFTIEVAGPAGGKNYPLSVLLDTVARTQILKNGYLIL